MKKYRFFIALMLLLASNALFNTQDTNKVNIDSDLRKPQSKVQYKSHDAIYIDGNDSLIGNASAEGWTGDGSASNPYIIDDLQIINSSYSLIEIRNTNLHFQINNCILTGGLDNYGIVLINVGNASIIENQINECSDGVRLDHSSRIVIHKNNVSDCTYSGIRLRDSSSNNNITSNRVYNNGDEGIKSFTGGNPDSNCDYNTFYDNYVYQNGVDGIALHGILFNNVTDNYVYDNTRYGILLKGNNNTLKSNHIYDNKDIGVWLVKSDWPDYNHFNNLTNNEIYSNVKNGIKLSDSYGNNLTGNQVSHNGEWGVLFERSGNSTIIGNTLTNDSVLILGEAISQCLQDSVSANLVDEKPLVFWQNILGGTISSNAGQIILINCTQVEVTSVDLATSEMGLLSRFCLELNIHDNSFSGASEYGIYLEHTNDSIIAINDIFNNNFGLYSFHCNNNTISQNEIFQNTEGVRITSTSSYDLGDNQILNNEVYNNKNGISITDYGYRNNISNNVISGNERGLRITTFSHNNSILNNQISDIELDGIYITSSYRTVIKDNTVFNCTDGINVISYVYHSYIENNTVYNCSSNGIKIDWNFHQSNNTVIKNIVFDNKYGIHVIKSHQNIIKDNYAYDNQEAGITMLNSHDNIVFNNSVYQNGNTDDYWVGGIIARTSYDTSNNNSIANNTVFSNTGHGIWASQVGKICIANNTVYDTSQSTTYDIGHGIRVNDGTNCTVANNSVYMNTGHGIAIINQANTTIADNILSNNKLGIYMEISANNSLVGNVLTNDYVYIKGSDLSHYILLQESNNWINGKTLVYWKSINSGTAPTNGGQLILVNCNIIEVTNINTPIEAAFCTDLYIHDNSIQGTELSGLSLHYSDNTLASYNNINNSIIGIELLSTNDSTFHTNNILNNQEAGVFLYASDNNTIRNSDISGNGADGIDVSGSSTNQIVDNEISNNSGNGVILQDYYFNFALYYSDSNNVSSNIIAHNSEFALYIDADCDDNIVKQNDFIENLVANHDGVNTLDISHNYWFPYWTKPDTDSDGIVDNPYSFPNSGDNRNDPYPLSAPAHYWVHVLSTPTISQISDYLGQGMFSYQWAASIDSYGYSVTYSLYYSIDNGVTWKLLIADYNGTRYDFPAWLEFAGHNNTEAMGKVVASSDSLTKEAYYNFTIKYPSHTLSTPTIIKPNGGETFLSTSPITIEWTTSVDSLSHDFTYSIYYSADGGSTWIELKSGLPYSQKNYQWYPTGLEGSAFIVKVVAISKYGDITSEDTSDAPFTIQARVTTLPPITTTTTTTAPPSTQPPEIESSPGWTPVVFLISLISYIVFRRLRKK